MPIIIDGTGSITGLTATGISAVQNLPATGTITNLTSTTATVTNLTSTTATVTTLNAPSGVLATQNGMTGIAKAWVNFNGTGTVAIRDSFNVSSITDNGTGDYTINFTTAMSSVNYCWLGIAKNVDGAANYNYPSVGNRFTTTPATTSIRVGTAYQQSAAPNDFEYVYVAVFSS